MKLLTDDAELFYEVRGKGPDIVLLHPFPSSHEFWNGVVERIESRYRVLMPDLRGLGRSEPGEGAATMAKHAEDLEQLCRECAVGKAVFVGCSIGGYVLFEYWRRHRERVKSLVLCDTKAAADSGDVQAQRLKTADEVMQRGPEFVIESMLPKLLGESTQRNRPDVVAAARATMSHSTKEGIAAVQRGMAERADSTATLANIDVATLVVGSDEDVLSPRADMEKIAKGVRGAELKMIGKAGHLAPFEQPEEFVRLLRQFLEKVY